MLLRARREGAAQTSGMRTTRYEHLMEQFGDRLRAARKRKYRFASHFAQDLGMESPTYRRYERGEVEPDIELLVRMCDLLEVTADALIPTRADDGHKQAQKRGSQPQEAA